MPGPWPDGVQSMMLDPSLVFSEQGPELMQLSLDAGVELVVPRIVTQWVGGVGDVDPGSILGPEDAEMFDARLAMVRELSPPLRSFDHEGVELDESALAVLDRLRSTDDPAAFVWADEWAYLQANSWLASKLRRCLDAFESAGAVIVEFGKEVGIELIEDVIPAEHVPSSIDRNLILRAAAKWIVVGGVHALGGTVGSVAGAGVGGPVGAVIGEKLAGLGAKHFARKVVLAVDP